MILLRRVDFWLTRRWCTLWHHRGYVEYYTGYAECQRCWKVWTMAND